MYMRIVRAQPPEGAGEEIGRRWAEFMPERLRQIPGFRHGHFGIDRASGTLAGVTVFDERPDDAAFAKLSEEFRNSLGASIAPQPPESTVYEIIAEA
jgi:hypothetical protein